MIKKVLGYIANRTSLWYHKYRIGNSAGVVNMKGILSAKELANYIEEYYKINFKKDSISPLKLQKSLYFCFAYWGGFARKNNEYSSRERENIQLETSEYLFDDAIEAWVYGPVVPNVYHEQNLEKYKNNKLFDNHEYLKKFIDNVLDDILALNDFRLVEISHEDKCWKKNFSKKNMFHNIEISKEEIIKEYAVRENY